MLRKLLISACLILCAFSPSFAQPNPTSNKVLFLLDASGSMWQKLDDAFKVTIAKTVLQNLVNNLPDHTHAGLIAYGHNRKSDCSDIETLIPLAPLDKKRFAERLDALNPVGMTPIAKSIEHALKILDQESEPVTCILVSDGLETCSGDACDLVRQAKARGVRLTMHVIGFGLEEQDLSALECIAQAGGGQYFPANNAEELGKALEKTVEAPPVDGGFLSVKATLDGQLKDAIVRVYKTGDTEEIAEGRTYEGAGTNPRTIRLPAGSYTVKVGAMRIEGNAEQTFQDVWVKGPDTIHLAADFSQVTVEVLVTRNGALSDGVVSLIDPATGKAVAQTRSYRSAKSNPAKLVVIPGVYQVQIKGIEIAGDPVKTFDSQPIAAGKTLTFSHDFSSGELKIGARTGSTLVDAAVTVHQKTDNKNIAGGRTYTSASSNPKGFTLPPGKYKVVVKPVRPKDLAQKTLEVEVTAQGVTEKTVEW
ncbi:MAG: VWA domain-containing protein [Lewinellaceae bacterium]|nr:VWA domain-containing protein [Lewinellaceae bacterium]